MDWDVERVVIVWVSFFILGFWESVLFCVVNFGFCYFVNIVVYVFNLFLGWGVMCYMFKCNLVFKEFRVLFLGECYF